MLKLLIVILLTLNHSVERDTYIWEVTIPRWRTEVREDVHTQTDIVWLIHFNDTVDCSCGVEALVTYVQSVERFIVRGSLFILRRKHVDQS